MLAARRMMIATAVAAGPALTFVDAAAATFADTTSATIDPLLIAAGDSLFLLVQKEDDGSTTTVPAGFFRVAAAAHFYSASGTADTYGELYVKTATSADVGASITVTNSAAVQGQAVAFAYTSNGNTPIVSDSYADYTTSPSASLGRDDDGGMFTTAAASRIVTVWLAVDPSTFLAPELTAPSGMTDRLDASAPGSDRGSTVLVADELQTTAGRPVNRTATLSSTGNMAALTIALTP